jgi:starvation-inducible DNA-binding protein
MTVKTIQVEIAPNAKEEIIEGLYQTVAETAVLTMKAQNFHWNVTGMAFGPLHALFQTLYEDHFLGQDLLAERMRALGGYVDGRYASFLKRSAVEEAGADAISAKDMVAALKADQETLSTSLRTLAELADEHGDVVTNDLAIERANVHDKFAWMLGAHLEG